MSRIRDLNKIKRHYTDVDNVEPYERSLYDFSIENIDLNVVGASVHFRNIENAIVERIDQADVVVGCVAWMTSEPILRALSRKIGVSIILQKEDFLRPDTNQNFANKRSLQDLYNAVTPVYLMRFESEIQVRGKSALIDDDGRMSDFSFRCIGHVKQPHEYAMPRMHHKFLVFCKYVDDFDCADPESSPYVPYAIWTGSYNMTTNATRSLENGIYIPSSDVARRYYQEWEQLIMVSESLDWTSDYAEPELEINTLACIS